VDFEITGLSSSLGSAYTGYFGVKGGLLGSGNSNIVTLADLVAGGPNAIGPIGPGEWGQFAVTAVCWDPTCTAAAPAGAVPNMFSVQFIEATPSSSDLSLTPNPRMTLQFLDGNGQVTWHSRKYSPRLRSR